MKTLIIAEKPSLAREIQNMLQISFSETFSSKGDYQESQNYLLSSFFGHLLQMAEPDHYDQKYKRWSLSDLPILPENFIYQYKDTTKERGELLKKLSLQCDSLVNATDPDREGEGIFRTWHNYENINKPFKRLWATSLTLPDLTKAWKNLKESRVYDSLWESQQARSQSDWLVGMNASRLYTILTGDKCPIGRVKTASLKIIVTRDLEVENYKESFTYSLTAQWFGFNFTFIDQDGNIKFEDKNFLESILKIVSTTNFSILTKTKDEKRLNPPKTFSQPDLQKEADNRFGFPLDETLKITQSLYEKKLVTYPRTDSPYLPESDLNSYYDLISKMANDQQKELLLPAGTKPPSVKNTDSPHTAIIPTGQNANGLSEDEQKIYTLIVERFITAFMKPKIYDEYQFIISNGSEKLRSIVKSVKDFGFQALYKTIDEEGENEQEVNGIDEEKLSNLSSPLQNPIINSIKKTKAKYYTPATFLTAMMNAGKTLEDKEAREILSEVEGLGTAATRQLYPVELEKNGFIEKRGKYLVSVDKGRKLIELIAPCLKSVEETAVLEKKLRLIESGKYEPIAYRNEINLYVNSFISQANSSSQLIAESFGLTRVCPKCGGTLTRLKCGSCDFHFNNGYTSIAGKQLSQENIDELLTNKKTSLIKGFEGKNGKFNAILRFNDEFKIIFDNDEVGTCKCGGTIIESPKAFNCNKCKITVWKEVSGKTLSKTTVVSLLNGKKIPGKGFKSTKTGKTFDATLYIDKDGKLAFEFSNKK